MFLSTYLLITYLSIAWIQMFLQLVAVRTDSVLSIFSQILKIMGIRIESLVAW